MSGNIWSAFTGDVNVAGILVRNRSEIRRQRFVREKMMAIVQVSCTYGGVAPKLAGVRDEQGGSAIGNDGLSRLDLAGVEIQQCAVFINATDAEDSKISLEAGKEIYRGITDDISVEGTQGPAGDGDFRIRVARECRRDIQVVGDDAQVSAARKRLRDVFGVVPNPIINDAPPSGIKSETASAMRRLASGFKPCRLP